MKNSLPTNSFFVMIWRFFRIISLIFSALLIMIFIYPFIDQKKRFERLRTWSKSMMSILKLEITVKGDLPESFDGALIMANHVSWLDIFALYYVTPVRFVAKQEIRKWPILGGMVARAGTVFIDRTDKRDAVRISQNIATCLKEGGTVSVFPESTTTNGFRLLPLKAALFESVLSAKTKVLPAAILYYDENHERSVLPSYEGETSLFESLFLILKKMRSGYIEIIFCPSIEPTENDDRFGLCKKTQAALEPIVYSGLPEDVENSENSTADS